MSSDFSSTISRKSSIVNLLDRISVQDPGICLLLGRSTVILNSNGHLLIQGYFEYYYSRLAPSQ